MNKRKLVTMRKLHADLGYYRWQVKMWCLRNIYWKTQRIRDFFTGRPCPDCELPAWRGDHDNCIPF